MKRAGGEGDQKEPSGKRKYKIPSIRELMVADAISLCCRLARLATRVNATRRVAKGMGGVPVSPYQSARDTGEKRTRAAPELALCVWGFGGLY